MTGAARASLVEGVVVALWLGAAAFFSIVVARAAFAVLPTRTLAGALVGRVLPVLFLTGIIVGLVVVAIHAIERTGVPGRWLHLGAGLVMIVACSAAQFVVAPRIERLRAAIGGSLESLPPGHPERAAFGRLHAISVGWLGVAILAACVALLLVWRALEARRPHPSSSTLTVQTDG